jgi:DNA-binding NarL/FixJ family response regulator
MPALRILVADDHEIVRRGICALLASRPGWEICGEASDGRDAVEKVRKLHPDITVLDISMPSLNGLEATRQIVSQDPRNRVLVLSVNASPQLVEEALQAGAKGYISKSDAAKDLLEAVEALCQGRPYFNSQVSEIVLNGYLRGRAAVLSYRTPEKLTAREREVVQLIVEGHSTKQVAVTLGVSLKTAETHRSNIMRKLRVHSASELVLLALRNNIVQIGRDTTDPISGTQA